MIQLSPSNAVYEGILNFNNHPLKLRSSARATLDAAHEDFRFEFNGDRFYYFIKTNLMGSCHGDQGICIRNFFIQEVPTDPGALYFVAFTFRCSTTGTFHVDGMLEQRPGLDFNLS